MGRTKAKTEGGCSITELQNLQKLVVKSLTAEIEAGMRTGEVNPSTIKNALQICRDNNIVAIDDTMSDYDRLSALLPTITPVTTNDKVYAAYE